MFFLDRFGRCTLRFESLNFELLGKDEFSGDGLGMAGELPLERERIRGFSLLVFPWMPRNCLIFLTQKASNEGGKLAYIEGMFLQLLAFLSIKLFPHFGFRLNLSCYESLRFL